MIDPIEVIQPLRPANLVGSLLVPTPSRGGRASSAPERLSSRSHVLLAGLSIDASSRLEVPQKEAAAVSPGHSLSNGIDLS
jgi:hypothetical protein